MGTDQDSADRRVRTVCLLILTVIAVGVALSLLQPVLVPFFLALFLTYCLTPVIDFQVRRLRLPPTLALAVAGTLGLVLVLLFGLLAAHSLAKIAGNIEVYEDRIAQLTEQAAQAVPLDRLGIRPEAESGKFFVITENVGRKLFDSFLTALTDVLSTGSLVLVFMIFMLLGRKSGVRDPTSLLGAIEKRVRRYLLQLVGLSALTGLLVGAALAALGVEFAWVFAFLTFLLNFIPNVGAVVAALLPLPVILLTPDMSTAAQVLAVLLPGVVQVVIGSVVQPKVLAGALDLHPVALLMALIFFGMIWGVIGAFLAMPITGVIRIVLERIPATRPVASLLAGDLSVLSRPADVRGS